MRARKIIATAALCLTDLPPENARWDTLAAFALTYDPAEIGDYSAKASDLSNATGSSSLAELRAHLYVEQRRWNHYGVPPNGKDLAVLKQIIEWMRKLLTDS